MTGCACATACHRSTESQCYKAHLQQRWQQEQQAAEMHALHTSKGRSKLTGQQSTLLPPPPEVRKVKRTVSFVGVEHLSGGLQSPAARGSQQHAQQRRRASDGGCCVAGDLQKLERQREIWLRPQQPGGSRQTAAASDCPLLWQPLIRKDGAAHAAHKFAQLRLQPSPAVAADAGTSCRPHSGTNVGALFARVKGREGVKPALKQSCRAAQPQPEQGLPGGLQDGNQHKPQGQLVGLMEQQTGQQVGPGAMTPLLVSNAFAGADAGGRDVGQHHRTESMDILRPRLGAQGATEDPRCALHSHCAAPGSSQADNRTGKFEISR